MLSKAYVEITNVCNLSCSFCPGTKRAKKFMSPDEFRLIAEKLAGKVEYVYLHLMGEPLLHPHLSEILAICEELCLRVIITTNGTLLKKSGECLLNSPAIHKISVSLHSFEANDKDLSPESYLKDVFDYMHRSAERGIISVMRMWNLDGNGTVGENDMNDLIIEQMRQAFPGEWVKTRSGSRIAHKTYIEWGEKFDWPDPEGESYSEWGYCYGVHSQIGILVDGAVVPCCLDHDGDIPLGNIFESDLDAVLGSDRATAMAAGFKNRVFTEELCKRCGFARKF